MVDVAGDATFEEVIFDMIFATIFKWRFEIKDKLDICQKIFKKLRFLLHKMEGKLDFFEENCG